MFACSGFWPWRAWDSSRATDPRRAGLNIYFIDVMGGAATLVVTPESETLLIDSGWPGQEDRDPKRIVHVLKDVAGCDHLDHLVTTHWHMDHFGGVAGLSKRVEIGQFWDRGLPEDRLEDLDFPDGPKPDDPLAIAYRKASAGKRQVLHAGRYLAAQGRRGARAGLRQQVIASTSAPANPLCADAPPTSRSTAATTPAASSCGSRSATFDFLDAADSPGTSRRAGLPADRSARSTSTRSRITGWTSRTTRPC